MRPYLSSSGRSLLKRLLFVVFPIARDDNEQKQLSLFFFLYEGFNERFYGSVLSIICVSKDVFSVSCLLLRRS